MAQDAGVDIDFDSGQVINPALDRELARVQGTAAKVIPATAVDVDVAVNGNGNGHAPPAETVEFMDRRFRIADRIGLMPLLKFSAFADVATNDPRALGAMYAMLRDCIHPGSPGCGECEACKADNERACPQFDAGDWTAFENHAMATRADAEDLFDVISKVMELIAGRPTKPSGPSSPGQRRTSGGSTGNSSARKRRASKR